MEHASSQNWFWPEWIIIIGRFPSVRSDQSVLKWNVRVLRTGSGQNGPARGSEPLGSPAPGDYFFTPTSRWRTVTAHLLFVKSYHRAIDGC